MSLLLNIIKVEIEISNYYNKIKLILRLDFFNYYRTISIINKFPIIYLYRIIIKGHFSYN
jgi:hypothetical protein